MGDALGAGLGVDRVGLVVDDHQAVVVAEDEVDVALERDAVERHRHVGLAPMGASGRAPHVRARDRGARQRGNRLLVTQYAFGRGLRGRGRFDVESRGQLDRLQRRVHGTADRGAVPTLVPGWQLEIATVLGQPRVVDRHEVEPVRQRRCRHEPPPVPAQMGTVVFGLPRLGGETRRGGRAGGDTVRVGKEVEPALVRLGPLCAGRRVPEQLRVGPARAVVGVERVRTPVNRDDEMVAGPGARDVQQAQLLVEAHLLVDRLVQLELGGLHAGREPHLAPAGRREQHLHAARRGLGRGGHARAHHDRELEALGAVDRHDANRIVVGLGHDGFDDARALGALQLRPREVVAQRAAHGIGVRARLVDEKTDPARDIAEPAGQHADLDDRTVPHDPFEELARRRPHAIVVQLAEEANRTHDRIVCSQRRGRGRGHVPATTAFDLEAEQIVVAATEQRRTQRDHERKGVARVVDRPQCGEEIAHLATAVDE